MFAIFVPGRPPQLLSLAALLLCFSSGGVLAQQDQQQFVLQKSLKLGKNPHQISFIKHGSLAVVAHAGENRLFVMDAGKLQTVASFPVEKTPLGVAELPGGTTLAVTHFQGNSISKLDAESGKVLGQVITGDGPSTLVGPLPGGRFLVSAERAQKMWVLDGKTFKLERSYPTGQRPFPPAATSDGRLAFVPNLDDGSVTIIDLWNQRVETTVPVGSQPSGVVVLPGDLECAVALRGENKLVFINTASKRVVGEIKQGLGQGPFSIVVAPNGRLAFVNATRSNEVVVLALPSRKVIGRIPTGKIPILMGVSPSGGQVWVSCEGSHEVQVFRIPETWQGPAPLQAARPGRKTEVAVMGMIHGQHRRSKRWGLEQVRAAVRRYHPDVICPEIPPDRWKRIQKDYRERGVFEDSRVRLFPEYVDVLIPLQKKLGFVIEPCAAWTSEMAALRRVRMKQFRSDPRFAARRKDYNQRMAEAHNPLTDTDDPLVIHSRAYDKAIEAELSIYDEVLNNVIGPGGWSNINRGHMRLINRALDRHRGARVLITFGSGHKYWILRALAKRKDVKLVDLKPYLVAGKRSGSAPKESRSGKEP